MAIQTFAAINLGSFALELGIYEMAGKGEIRQIDQVRHTISLGRETFHNGKISYEMVEEICSVLKDFSQIMKSYRVSAYRAYATTAMREAKNSQIILDQIQVRTGIQVRVISNSEQRFLSYKAIALKDAEFQKVIQKGTAIAEVGFGSMQLSLFDKDSLVSTQNLPLGVLRIQELLSQIPADREGHQEHILEIVDNELFTFRKMYLKDRDIKNLIATGEPILYLFRNFTGGKQKDRITVEEFGGLYEKITAMNSEQMEEFLGVSREYARLLLPSAMIYKRILEITGAESFWIPGISIQDGIAAEYAESMKQIKFNHNFENDIVAASRNMAKRYKCHTSHNQTVEKYALDIFDSMKRFHGLSRRDRLLLQISVLLHACGKFISMKNSNECAYNMIMATEIIGLSHLEREIIANVVRYNIRDFDYNKVHIEEDLSGYENQNISQRDITIRIAKMTAILRLANSMDRSHKQKLADCKTMVRDGELIVTTEYDGDIALEAMSFQQKADFFEEIFSIRPVLRQKRRI